ncbi:hypothetical protein ASG43_19200 [Aureimonas sp. Leaf454]|uniref:TfuA-like protein n=1 Tax=Aureimonas sp. Leaf454 TaxID=1736381 RepID=UPI0006FE3377|nr:TfuA-like protein [Aureimonas sp. Leaf454]KQT53111.1 hypothetical protein ASG43_19200 [Aureimonas sp. Leaf454]
MVKVLFAGPSLHGVAERPADIERRAPARQGDLLAAVHDGATVIGLVDGLFETVASVWHKEILFALAEGVEVLGAASLGALRAAECAPFGMVPVGWIAQRYIGGELDDDAAVAQLHAPAELGFQAVTEALVDVEAAVADLRRRSAVSPAEASRLLAAARATFFKERTYARLAETAGLSRERGLEIKAAVGALGPRLKQRDALRLVEAMLALPDARRSVRPGWTLSRPAAFSRSLATAVAGSGPVTTDLPSLQP